MSENVTYTISGKTFRCLVPDVPLSKELESVDLSTAEPAVVDVPGQELEYLEVNVVLCGAAVICRAVDYKKHTRKGILAEVPEKTCLRQRREYTCPANKSPDAKIE